MYKPNFCAECGERVTRARWHLWTSRRFCRECAPRLRGARAVLPLLAGAALFGVGISAGRAVRPTTPPLIVERRDALTTPTQTTRPQPLSANMTTESPAATLKPASTMSDAATKSAGEHTEVVSICGALTKKGTPCQRRVRGTGRCWQHKGMPASLPLEERLVK